jgi:MEMO1 family protein
MQPQVRKAAVAGRFYPRSARELHASVARYLAEADIEPAPEKVVAIVAPHAGYIYSGPTAGFAFRRVQGKKPKRAVLLGCSHHYRFQAASVYQAGSFEIPIAEFPIDHTFASALAQQVATCSAEPHWNEHSLEVHLPFLAAAVGPVPIVPVLFGDAPDRWHEQFGATLAGMVEEDDLVLVSTDLSHYLPESEANDADQHAIQVLLAQDEDAFIEEYRRGACAMCGAAAVVAGMAYCHARGARAWSLLDYRTSAQASGDFRRVVGYASVSMERAA